MHSKITAHDLILIYTKSQQHKQKGKASFTVYNQEGYINSIYHAVDQFVCIK